MKSANLNSKDPFYPSNHQHPISKISKAEKMLLKPSVSAKVIFTQQFGTQNLKKS